MFLALALPVVAGALDTLPVALVPAGAALRLKQVAYGLGFVAGVAAQLALLEFLQSLLATRARDSELARAVRRTFWEVALEMSSAGAFVGYATLIQRTSILTLSNDRSVSLATVIVALLLFWSLVQLIHLMLKVRSALQTQEMLARQFWPPPSRTVAPTAPPPQ